MFSLGKNDSKDYQISWINAPAEQTTLADESMDWMITSTLLLMNCLALNY